MCTIMYHKTHSYNKAGDKNKSAIYFTTQLYKIGVYAIINNNPKLQFNFRPSDIVSLEKKLKKALRNKEIENLKFGPPITVTDESGYWEVV